MPVCRMDAIARGSAMTCRLLAVVMARTEGAVQARWDVTTDGAGEGGWGRNTTQSKWVDRGKEGSSEGMTEWSCNREPELKTSILALCPKFLFSGDNSKGFKKIHLCNRMTKIWKWTLNILEIKLFCQMLFLWSRMNFFSTNKVDSRNFQHQLTLF